MAAEQVQQGDTLSWQAVELQRPVAGASADTCVAPDASCHIPARSLTRLRADGAHHDWHQGEGLACHDMHNVGQVQLQAVLSLISVATHLFELASGPQLRIHLAVYGRRACRAVEGSSR